VIIGVFILCITLVVAIPMCALSNESTEQLDTYTASLGNITYSVSGDGIIEQANITTITPDISARITVANCIQGDIVNAGDIIYEFDTSSIDLEIKKAQLAYDQAKISYTNSSGTEKKLNKINMQTAEIELNECKEKLNNYKIVAPISGIIIKANYSVGDYFDATGGNELIVIADPKTFEVNFYVDESYITQIVNGQKATIDIKSADPSNYIGVVEGYDLMGTAENGITTYYVCVKFDAPEEAKLLYGMSANVSVVLAEKENVLLIPSSAINKDGNVIILSDNQNYRTISVELGVCDDKYVEVLSGLKVGDIILTNPEKYSG